MSKFVVIFKNKNFFIFLFNHIFIFQKNIFFRFNLGLKKKYFFLLYILKLMINFGFFNIYFLKKSKV